MRHLEGYVDHIRFRNDKNGYTVLSLDLDGEEETVVGLFPFFERRGICLFGRRICGSSGSWASIPDEEL